MDAQENQLYTGILIAIIVIGSIICYFIITLFRTHRKILSLQKQYAAAEVNLLEKDRERIANDIHDEISPMLVAAKMRINSFDLNNETDLTQLDKANENIDEIAKRMRSISYNLMPVTLKMKGLIVTVQEFLKQFNRKNHLEIEFLTPAVPIQLDDEMTIHTYRIIQEIVHNTFKHAQATLLTIALKKESNRLVLVTKDNGIGFDFDHQLKEAPGLGLRSLMNRISLLRSRCTVKSLVGKGTEFQIEIPLKHD